MARRIYSTLFWVFITVSSILFFPVAVLIWAVTAPFDRRKRLLHLFTCFWASTYTWLTRPIRSITTRGKTPMMPSSARNSRYSFSALVTRAPISAPL